MLVLGRLALALALGLGDAPPTTEDPVALYKEANRLRSADDLAGAARMFARAHLVLRAQELDHANVLDSLVETLDLTLRAHARAPDVALLCEATELFRSYAASLAARNQTVLPDVVPLGDQVAAELERAGASCPEEIEAPPVAPAPAPTTRPEGPREPEPAPRLQEDAKVRKLRIGAYSGLGVAGIGLVVLAAGAGVGASAERAGWAAAADRSAADLQDSVIARGRVANSLFIAGAVLAGTALIAALGLLGASRRLERGAARRRAGVAAVIWF